MTESPEPTRAGTAQRKAGPARRALSIALRLVIGVALIPVALTGPSLTQRTGDGPAKIDGRAHPEQAGVARVRTCEEHGPLSLFGGLGHRWSCTADVTWGNGAHDRMSFSNSQLTPQDRGRLVSVVRDRARHQHRLDSRAVRNVERPYAWLGWVVFALFGLPALGLLSSTLFRIRPRAWRRRINMPK